jgi:hypothetical protein
MVLVKLLVDSQRSARMNPKLLSAGLAHFSKNLARSFVPQQMFFCRNLLCLFKQDQIKELGQHKATPAFGLRHCLRGPAALVRERGRMSGTSPLPDSDWTGAYDKRPQLQKTALLVTHLTLRAR